jgi:hypothetical protein
MKPITGQYECVHHSGIGLDYFTSRIDRLVLYPDGRFTLTIQQMSRATNAAKSWLNKQTVNNAPPENRQEGHYTQQGQSILLHFDNGGFEKAHLSPNADGVQIGPNHFPKVSDSPVLPSAQRVKQDMDDIAKGLKIASALGTVAIKAAQTLQGAISTGQGQSSENPSTSVSNASSQQGHAQTAPPYQASPTVGAPGVAAAQQSPANTANSATSASQARFCEQCGEQLRPDKRFCNHCGARIN